MCHLKRKNKRNTRFWYGYVVVYGWLYNKCYPKTGVPYRYLEDLLDVITQKKFDLFQIEILFFCIDSFKLFPYLCVTYIFHISFIYVRAEVKYTMTYQKYLIAWCTSNLQGHYKRQKCAPSIWIKSIFLQLGKNACDNTLKSNEYPF